jgi:hypothetical protein
MLNNIYKQRYGKLLLGLCLFLLLIYIGFGWLSQQSWHSQKDYYNSEHFEKDFKNHPKYYVEYSIGEKTVSDSLIKEYVDQQLTITNKPDRNIYGNYTTSGAYLILPLLFIFGFLSFFVDQKTNFTRFLFSLPYSRRQLFRQKIISLLVPVGLSLAIGILGNILIRYLMIPADYFQIPLTDLFASGIATFVGNLTVTTIGFLLGVLLGNLFFGPISIVVLFFLMGGFYSFFYNLQEFFSYLFFGTGTYRISQIIWNTWPEGEPSAWWATLSLFVIAGVFVLAAQEVFARISLENDGDYLTVPALRLPAFLVMCLGTWFYLLNMNGILRYFYFSDYNHASLVTQIIVYFVICVTISFLLIYPKVIKNWWHTRRFLNPDSNDL